MKLFKKINKGFTLVELVVVIAVIAILSAVSVVAYTSITKNAKKASAKADADSIVSVIRASVLAESKGYYEEEKEIPSGENTGAYKVSLNDRELTITRAGVGDTRTDVAILNDMLAELGERLEADAFSTSEHVSKIGVLLSGSETEYEYSEF